MENIDPIPSSAGPEMADVSGSDSNRELVRQFQLNYEEANSSFRGDRILSGITQAREWRGSDVI